MDMKKFLYVWLVVLLFSITTFGQTNPLCPVVKFTMPKYFTQPGAEMAFSVFVGGESKNLKLEYNWSVSAGKIAEGQGTAAIKLSTTMEMQGSFVTAKVEIKGLPKNCPNKFSGGGLLASINYDPLDSYGKVSLREEIARFDNLYFSLAMDKTSRGFILMEISEKETFAAAKKRIRALLKFITERRIYSKDKITFAIKKSSEHRTTIIVVPKDIKLPECENCEIIKGADFKIAKRKNRK